MKQKRLDKLGSYGASTWPICVFHLFIHIHHIYSTHKTDIAFLRFFEVYRQSNKFCFLAVLGSVWCPYFWKDTELQKGLQACLQVFLPLKKLLWVRTWEILFIGSLTLNMLLCFENWRKNWNLRGLKGLSTIIELSVSVPSKQASLRVRKFSNVLCGNQVMFVTIMHIFALIFSKL